MADATITTGGYGFKATGGVDNTLVTAKRTRVSTIVVTAGTAAGGAVTISTGATTAAGVSYGIFNAASASRSASYVINADLDGVSVTLTAADVVAIINTPASGF